jgi:RND superfamily putative drug exporter
MPGVFTRLGDFVVRRHKAIIVFWAVALLVAAPLILRVGEITAYEETKLMPSDIESAKASEVVKEEFPTGLANSTVIVVIQATDVTDASARDFVLELGDSVTASPHITYLTGATSVYTVYASMLDAYVANINPLLYAMEAQANATAFTFYGVADYAAQAWLGVNSTAHVIYDLPAMHMQNWAYGTNPGNATWQRDMEAYNLTLASLPGYFAAAGANASTQAMLGGYYSIFYSNWSATSVDPALAANPPARASQAVNGSFPGLLAMVPDPLMQGQLVSTHENLTVANYGSAVQQSGVAYGLIRPMLGAYDIPDEQRPMLYGWLDAFFQAWNATFLDQSLVSSSPSTRAGVTVQNAGPAFIGSLPIGEQNRTVMLQMLASFDMTSWADPPRAHAFAIGFISATPMPELLPAAFLEQTYNLGSAPTAGEVSAFTRSIIENGTLDTYPMSIPIEIASNFVSEDRSTMLVVFEFSKESGFIADNGTKPIVDDIGTLRLLIASIKAEQGSGVATYVSGDAAISADIEGAFSQEYELIVTVVLLFVLTGWFFRSALTPFVSLGTMSMALGISQAAVFLIGYYVVNVHFAALSILMTALLGAGTDYSIFLLARYREERTLGRAREEAVRKSIEWAGESISTSGVAVIVSFAALSIASFDLVKTIGWIVSIGIVIALLMALTFIPSLVMMLGNRVFWPSGKYWRNNKERLERPTYFTRSAHFSIKHAKAIVLAAILISVPATYVYFSADTSFDFIAVMPKSEGKDGMAAMQEGFGAGKIMPTQVVIVLERPARANGQFDYEVLDAVERANAELAAMDGVRSVQGPTRPQGALVDYRGIANLSAQDRAKTEALMLQYVGVGNATVMLQVVFQAEPFSQDALSMIPEMRDDLEGMASADPVLATATVYVGGGSAVMFDIKSTLDADFQIMSLVVLIGIFIVLMVVLGSILIPVRAILTIALSISWTLAVTVVLFDHILGMPVLWLIPIILFVILMGLGMDYDIFLITRIREEVVKGKTDEQAIATSVERTGGIITACGIIMAGAFGSLMLSPMGMLQQMGFALAFAILLDATVVRIYLVPAIMVLAKKWNWWAPGRLQRVRVERPVLPVNPPQEGAQVPQAGKQAPPMSAKEAQTRPSKAGPPKSRDGNG